MKKASFLNSLATVAYCFCALIFIVWVAIIVAFCLGYYTPKTVYADDIIIEQASNPQIEFVGNQPVLRVNGISESDNPNIDIDASFIVKGTVPQEKDDEGNIIEGAPVTETVIYLSSTNEDVATVPKEAKLNEPITITVTKDATGVNKGGFCFINVKNAQGLFMQNPLCVFVDVPVTELKVESANMQTEIENEVEKFCIYESETGKVTTKFLPANSQDPTHIDNNKAFNSFRKNAKPLEYYLDENDSQNVITIDQAGNITALGVGEVTVWARTLRTYDDIDFIANYEPDQPEDAGYIPPELLEGRYIYTSFVVKVKAVTLDEICIGEGSIDLELFKTKAFTVEELGISLKASNGSTTYFNSMLSDIVLTTGNKELQLKKDSDSGKWEFTVLQEPSRGLSVDVTLPNSELSATLSLFTVELNAIKGLDFEGTSKSNPANEYNDQVLKTITKQNGAQSSINTTWNWTDNVEIVPNDDKTEPSYFKVKVFAIGAYHSGAYREDVFVNEQGEEIIQLGTTNFDGFGREVRGEDLKNPEVVQALSRGSIVLQAFVLKTDINGQPLDSDGNVIKFDADGNVVDDDGNIKTTNIPMLNSVAQSDTIVFKIVEKLERLEGYIEGMPNAEAEDDGKTFIDNRIIAVSNVSSLSIRLEANSKGALFDAFNNANELGSWLRASTANQSITQPTITQIEESETSQAYYLNINFSNNNAIQECTEQFVQVDYYTGTTQTSDGYEKIANFKFYVIDVPVEKIEINTNIEHTTTMDDGSKAYKLSGLITYQAQPVNGRLEVSSINVQWGVIDDEGNLTEFELLKPTITAGKPVTLQSLVEGRDYIVPKELVITNPGYTIEVPSEMMQYASVVTNLGDDTERAGELEIKQLSKPFKIVATANYNNSWGAELGSITDTIYVEGVLAGAGAVNLQWNTNAEATDEADKYTITVSSALLNSSNNEGGFKLREQDIFGLKLVGNGVEMQDVYISSTSEFISFELPSASLAFVSKTSDDRLVFASTAFDTSQTVDLDVIMTTENELQIKQRYTINFVVD